MNTQDRTQAISVVQDNLLQWMSCWQRAVLFAEDGLFGRPELQPPERLFSALVLEEDAIPDKRALSQVVALSAQMRNAALRVMAELEAGGSFDQDDYDAVLEPFWELVRKLRRLEKAFSLASSTIDALTGLKARRGMMDEVKREIDRSSRTGQPFCVAMCDIDHFKSINDTYGHDGGDRVLSAVSAVISENIRSFDDAYRMGGEEFLISLKNADQEVGQMVVERLRHVLENTSIILANGQEVTVTASFGLAPCAGGDDVDALLRQADEALYSAKRGGRNRVEVSGTAAA